MALHAGSQLTEWFRRAPVRIRLFVLHLFLLHFVPPVCHDACTALHHKLTGWLALRSIAHEQHGFIDFHLLVNRAYVRMKMLQPLVGSLS